MNIDKINRHRLTDKQLFTLCNWLPKQHDELQGKPRHEIASIATEALGFAVNVRHIANAAKIIDADWLQASKSKNKTEEIAELRQQIKLLSRAVLALSNNQRPPALEIIHKIAQ